MRKKIYIYKIIVYYTERASKQPSNAERLAHTEINAWKWAWECASEREKSIEIECNVKCRLVSLTHIDE